MTTNEHVYAVILAGGGGTRLWPKSRKKTPKQFLKLTENKTMMQVAAERLAQLVPWENIIVVTNDLYRNEIGQQLPKVPAENVIYEPEKKDTALAMLVGALFAKSKNPDAVIMNAASDHTLIDDPEFCRVMRASTDVASTTESLVTVGISPIYPTSAFGYIKVGDGLKQVDKDLPLYKVDSFTEKPDIATAKEFIATEKYFWNANMYVWSATELQKAFAKYMPEMNALTEALPAMSTEDFHAALPTIYEKAEAISIDYAISEKADNLTLIPGDFGWNDVGDWKVVYDLGEKDSDNNVVITESEKAESLLIESKNNLIHVKDKLVALVGVEDLAIVDTGEILMICPKDRSQEVKKLVNALKEKDKEEYL